MRASNLPRQLRHPIPPPPQEIPPRRNMCATGLLQCWNRPPVAAPSPAPVATPPAPAPAETLPPPPTPTSNSSAPIPMRVSRELEYEGYVEMPGRTRVEARALRDASCGYAHRHGLPLDHVAMVSMLVKGEATNEIVRQRGAPEDSPDLPTAHASDLPTPNNCVRRREVAPCRHRTYGDTPCTRNSMVFYRQVPSRRRRPSN